MAAKRNKKGQFVKGKGGKRKPATRKRRPATARGGVLVMPAMANKPAPRRRRRSKPNASPGAISEVLGDAMAAIGGGLLSFTGRSLLKRVVVDPTAHAVIDVGLPIATGAVLSQVASPRAQSAAAGAFGDAGAGVGLVISDAMRASVAAANPPGPFGWPNPPFGYLDDGDVAPLLAPAWLDPHRVTEGGY